MREAIAEPLKAADRHRFKVSFPSQSSETIDYMAGENILLHVSLRRHERRIVINDHIDGEWGRERYLPLGTAGSTELEIGFEAGLVRIGSGEESLWISDLRGDLAEALELRGSSGVSRLRPARAAEGAEKGPVLRLRACHAWSIAGEVTGLRGEGGVLRIGAGNGRAVLAELPVPDGGGRWSFQLPPGRLGSLPDGAQLRFAWIGAGDPVALGEARYTARLLGAIDRCSDRLVRGWAASGREDGLPLELDIYVDDVHQARVRADRYRADLVPYGAAFARGGFLFRFPGGLPHRAGKDCAVAVTIAETPVPLKGSPWWVGRATPPHPARLVREI